MAWMKKAINKLVGIKPEPVKPIRSSMANTKQFMDQVTPEIAAKIVKQYILPMFTKNGQKPTDGSVYSELKLTDKLAIHLEQE